MDPDLHQIRQELLEHVSQILTAISMKSKTLEQRLTQDNPQEARAAREIHELARQLIVSNRQMAQRLGTHPKPDESV
ncbi:MAG: hypothetical protein K9N55_16645 [Phycisphaerae bacterium]|nr:hypothetical protein [Phycisphaerae bacterium]